MKSHPVVAATAIGAAPVALAEGKYKNCTQAHQDGRYDEDIR
jgi:hypothetical protein